MIAKTFETLRNASFEVTFVVLGIALAFAADNWRDKREDRLKVLAARGSVLDEIRSNRETLAGSVDEHARILSAIRRDSGLSPDPKLLTNGFLTPARLQRAAWDAAEKNGALSRMDNRIVRTLARPYVLQERYATEARAQWNSLISDSAAGIPDKFNEVQRLLAVSIDQEKQLLVMFDETLMSVGTGFDVATPPANSLIAASTPTN